MPKNKTLWDIEADIRGQLDRLYRMLEDGMSFEFIKGEYGRLVELFSQKHALLMNELEAAKTDLTDEEYETRKKALEEQLKQDVVSVAAGIDETMTPEEQETK